MLMNKKQSGFSLIESLVAFLILSFALVGLMGLQTYGLQMTTSSLNRIKATYVAQDIAERMRSNMSGVGVSDYDMNKGAPSVGVAACTTTAGCSPAQMASNDLGSWIV